MAKKKRTLKASPPVADARAEEAGTPTTTPSFPVVGIGASAGGLEAFTQLLRALPVDTGMAFVLVQHLAPSRASALAGILSRATSMPVTEVTDEPEVEPNHVYVIPPDRNMIIVRGHLQLFRREAHGVQHPIDLFFRSLAQNHREMAIGVVLSGTATDGTLGLEEIKAEGGITFAQDDTAQYNGMPRSAVASGCVDLTLSPEGIASEIARIATHPYVTGAVVGQNAAGAKPATAPDKAALAPILHFLRNATDVDFSLYKTNTLSRRITRRTVLHKMEGLNDYARLLRDSPAEVEALYQDILINVTSFFRDPEMFEALKAKVIPALLEDRSRYDPLRVWVPGCSTGEEAYSLAMTLSEFMESSNGHAPAQIFATDLNAAGIEHGRAGVYSKQRLHDVSHERLRRFFTEVSGGFCVAKPLRDMCVFAQHNVMADPPFSQIDLISCRNLLIYLEPSLQQRIIPIFHYALKPNGHLVLGASETVGTFRELFQVEDTRHKIYAKKPGPSRLPLGLPIPRPRPGVVLDAAERVGPLEDPGAAPAGLRRTVGGTGVHDVHKEADRLLLTRFAPPGVLVNADLEILQFRGNTERYLVPAQGKATLSLMKMAREGLRVPLQALVHRAKKGLVAVRDEGLRVKSNGGTMELNLEIVPVRGSTASEVAFLVLFDEVAVADRPRATASKRKDKPEPAAERTSSEASNARLEHELASTREYLQSLIEQQDAANEELQSANEEAQSANEELQSMNEELETSKEEIQSSNEELTTVNDELNNRNLEMGQLNSDLNNLISSVQIAVVIVGRDLRIRRFSPMAEKLLNVIPADVGRPITDIRMKFALPELNSLLAEVIDTVGLREREVQDKRGCWYSLRIRPYLTVENKIDGAVLMLLDIDSLKEAEQAVAVARDHAANTVETVREPLLVLDAELRVESANRSFYRAFGIAPAETIGKSIFDLGDREWDIPRLRTLLQELLPHDTTLEDFQVDHDFAKLGWRSMMLNARRIADPAHKTERILLAIEDITERERHQQELQRARDYAEAIVHSSCDPLLILDADLHVRTANETFYTTFKVRPAETEGRSIFDLGNHQWKIPSLRKLLEDILPRHSSFNSFEVTRDFATIGRRTMLLNARALGDTGDSLSGILLSIQDITELLHFQTALRRSELRYRRLFEAAKDGVLIMDPATRKILDANPFMTELLGYTHDELLGRELFEIGLFKDEVASRLAFGDLQEQGFIRYDDLPLETKTGERREVEMVSNLYPEAEDNIIQCSVRDITARKRVEEAMRRSEEELAKRVEELAAMDSARGHFLAVLSHELRSPLSAICGWVHILQRPGASEDDLRKGLEVIDRNSKVQSQLIADLLDAHRIGTGKVALELENIDLSESVDSAIAAAEPAAAEKQVRLEREIDPAGAPVSADPRRLQQVMGNLLTNALKFTPPGGQIRVELRRTGSHAQVSVTDTGEGISPEALPHIFEPFRQAASGTSRGHGGLGLGLSIARQLMQLHAGSIEARSSGDGEGATFTITLPLRTLDGLAHQSVSAQSTAGTQPGSLGGIMVLVVDDEPDAREPVRRVLEEAGAEVIAVASADEALEAVRQQRPDVLVSDIGMPGRDGYELMRSIRALPPERGGRVPAIALTGYGAPEDRDRALSAGFESHLVKPVEPAVLIAAVSALVSPPETARARGAVSQKEPRTAVVDGRRPNRAG